ncbi:hypothetical protein MVEN_02412400 [Mycena venus]|uniref:Concanavalin A-like lectin/glucanase n=1 Tax=Mycena venus TaxID=2733690 RepID=A0A8H7CF03_9AGAR|nr:hypothetical protein MVEN_02412400 [Mycena venus]
MRAFAILSALAALSCAAAAPPVPSKASAYGDMTNGERLARGLPLKAPARRTKAARDSAASPVPSYTAKGHLLVRNAGDNSVIGYASHNVSVSTFITSDLDDALTVSVTLPVGATGGSQLNLAQVTSCGRIRPMRSLSSAWCRPPFSTTTDISTGSSNHLLIISTNDTPAGSFPQQPGNTPSEFFGTALSSESAVWTIDIVSGAAFPIWINSNGVAATTQLFSQNNAIFAGGDVDAFNKQSLFPLTPITLTWVPAV